MQSATTATKTELEQTVEFFNANKGKSFTSSYPAEKNMVLTVKAMKESHNWGMGSFTPVLVLSRKTVFQKETMNHPDVVCHIKNTDRLTILR